MVPKPFDTGYVDGDEDDQDPLQRALPNKQAFQHIRSFPLEPGQSVLFTHRIIHWGSSRDGSTTLPPRIAISFVCSDPTFEKPYIDPAYSDPATAKYPPFRIRLLLVRAQLLIYYQRFDLPKSCIKACYDYCRQHENEFDEAYRKKVFFEFVYATKDPGTCSEQEDCADMMLASEDHNDSDDDDVMEEMLKAEAGGYGEFHDDFDEVDGGVEDEDAGDDLSQDDCEDEVVSLFGKRAAVETRSASAKRSR